MRRIVPIGLRPYKRGQYAIIWRTNHRAKSQSRGVEYVFGYPGGAVIEIYDALFQLNKFKHILVRHEQAAVHAADAYARVSGKVGVALVLPAQA